MNIKILNLLKDIVYYKVNIIYKLVQENQYFKVK
jgi:hypothetical protein